MAKDMSEQDRVKLALANQRAAARIMQQRYGAASKEAGGLNLAGRRGGLITDYGYRPGVQNPDVTANTSVWRNLFKGAGQVGVQAANFESRLKNSPWYINIISKIDPEYAAATGRTPSGTGYNSSGPQRVI